MATVAHHGAAAAVRPASAGLPPRARLYLAAVVLPAAAGALAVLGLAAPTRDDWIAFVPLVLAGALAHAFAKHVPGNQVFHTGMVFTVAAVLLLPPQLVVLVCVVPHAVDWARQRYPWYIQTFNVSNYLVSALAAAGAAAGAAALLGEEAPAPRVGLVAALTFVAVNHALLAPMLVLARRQSLRETKLFSADGAMPDLVLALLGAGAALAFRFDPWALPIVLAPLVLIDRALAVPELLALARTDPKTGLFNWRHFTARLDEELDRARRFGRPLSVLVADLDLLRDVNTAYGHLGGDAVIAGIADVLREELRPYDIAARFGGEEFAVALPETSPETARAIAERVRAAVAERRFAARGAAEPIGATISIGVATFPDDALDAHELIRRADAAMYEAKRAGRDLVRSAA